MLMPKITARYKMPHKRRLRKKTDYLVRLKLVKSGLPRAVIRKSLENINIQIIKWEPSGDKVISSTSSKHLSKFGWKAPCGNIPAAYLTGLLAGFRAKEKGLERAVLDIGLQSSTKGSRLYAALKGLIDSGLSIPHNEKILPSEERITGQHIAKWAAIQEKWFSKYGVKPSELPEHFAAVKEKIISTFKG